MKRCPECRRDYYDDSLLYCLDDGGRLVDGPAAVGDFSTAILPGEAPTRAILQEGNPKGRTQRRNIVYAGVAALVAVAALVGYQLYSRGRTDKIESIAVMPFANESGNPEVEYLADGITESLINSLSQLGILNVKSRSTVFRYKGVEIEPARIGAELNVQALLKGRVANRGDELTISLELIESSSGNQLWGQQYSRKLIDLLSVQKEITRDVSQKLQARLAGAVKRQGTKAQTENTEAYQFYLKGRFHAAKLILPETQKAIAYYQLAIDRDPNYALAHVGMSRAYMSLALASEMQPNETFLKGKSAAHKASEIDPDSPEASVAVGVTAFWFDWNWTEAERRYKHALEQDQNSPETLWAYAHLLSNLGRHAEALPLARRCSELDPLDLRIRSLEAQFLIHAGKVDEALGRLREVQDLDPNFWMGHLFASSAYIERGMYEKAVEAADRATQLSPIQTSSVSMRGYALAKAGRRNAAITVVEELIKLSEQRFVPPYHIALIYNGLGETEKTLIWLEKGYQSRDPKMTFLKVEPKWNNLRGDARFVEMLRKVGFTN